ncbi:hypothetical protein NUW58_g58 [Xylaria curta]|uniref:Uncharacterized protein n=1 Tax=Xylaria curta TaxID=42375 RepID=A0ACC1PTX3_9PEZI|nr:hypothetical protein NUW58_g58 [Xylaria curta]
MKIAIIGAGISGLSQYLWLRKVGLLDDHSVTIYEAREAQDRSATAAANLETYNASVIGASIGLSPTGLHVLKRLDQDLYNEVLSTGHIIRTWRMSNARGWTLANTAAGGENEMMVMVGRDACCRLLRNRVPNDVIIRRKIVDVKLAEGNNRPALVFQDQTTEDFDFVIACDGIWSCVRRAMFGGQGQNQYEFSPQYEGLVGVGGFISSSKIRDTPAGEMNVVLGANGFFGYGYTTGDPQDSSKPGDTATWWSTYTLDKCPEDWRKIDAEDVKKELQKRHLTWQNSAIQNIVRDVEVDSLYPTFITPLLPTWEKGGCVLVGDAAHALQPSSGQGASMALEDCEALALLIRHYLKEDPNDGLGEAAKKYSDIRRPRLDMVFKKAQQIAGMKHDMGVIQEMFMYFFCLALLLLKGYGKLRAQFECITEPLRISKITPTHSPAKGGLSRPLSEISATEKRRNSPSWASPSKVCMYPAPSHRWAFEQALTELRRTQKMTLHTDSSPFQSSPLEAATSPRLFWQNQSANKLGENDLYGGRGGSPSPTKRSSIERLQKASRVKNSTMFAREQKQEYDPTRIPTFERPLAKVQGNAFAGTGRSGLRVGHGRTESQTNIPFYSPTKSVTSPTGPQNRPPTPSKDQPSPTKSSLSRFKSSYDSQNDDVFSDHSFEEPALPEGRYLHRHAKSVTFDAAPPQVNEYEMATPDLSSIGTNSREGSFESEEDDIYGSYPNSSCWP